jgi:hypothetical protein
MGAICGKTKEKELLMPLYFGQANSILFRTLPYVFLRMLLYFIFGIVFVVYWIIVYFIGQGMAHIHEIARVIVWIVAFVISFPMVKLFREYFLYILKAGHVAVIAELATKGKLPEGVNQIEWGKKQVMERFKETSVVFLVDRLVSGVIRSINGIMGRIGGMFSAIPGMEGVVKFAQVIVRFSLTYVDESILARNFVTTNETVWQSAKAGVVLYAQSWKEILKNAIVLGFVSVSSYAILLIIFLVPALGINGKLHPTLQVIGIIGAFVFAGVIKLAFFDPWALTTMIITYLKATQGKTPDRGWEEKIEAVSSKFKEIKQKAIAETASSVSTTVSTTVNPLKSA